MAWQYITQQQELEQIIPKLYQQPGWGFDTETTGLVPFKDKVTLIQIGSPETQYIIDVRKVNPEPLKAWFEDVERYKIGHNLKFDYRMMKASNGIHVETPRDTYIAEKLLENGRMLRGFSLDAVLKKYLEVEVDKTLQKSFIGHTGDFSTEQLEYAARDVEYLMPLSAVMMKKIRADGLVMPFKIECDCIPCFGDMEIEGLHFDKDRWLVLAQENFDLAQEVRADLNALAAGWWQPNLFGEVDINYGSPAQVVELLQRMRVMVIERDRQTGKFSEKLIDKSDDATLKRAKNSGIVKLIKKYRGYMVRYGTFGQSFVDALNPITGKLHPEFEQMGTETGRPASGDSQVNMLNIPRDKRMRNCFLAPENYVVETEDFSGCELRIWAHISQDPGLVGALKRGEDLHCYVATKLYGKNVTKTENKELRTPAKSLNFGRPEGFAALCA